MPNPRPARPDRRARASFVFRFSEPQPSHRQSSAPSAMVGMSQMGARFG